MTSLSGKVAFVTGVARGQGRSHALALAAEGADVIGVDICDDINTVEYPLATEADLDETAKLVEAQGRRAYLRRADIRDYDALKAVVDEGVAALGGLDVVVANAGIITYGHGRPFERFRDGIDVNLIGTWHTLEASVPHLVQQGRGGSIIITSSTTGLSGRTSEITAGARSYVASKHAVIGLMRSYALALGQHRIRVNTVNPTGVNTTMVTFDGGASIHERAEELPWDMSNTIPVPVIEPEDVSAAVVWLASDATRYVTGVVLPVDAGYGLK